jgi:hypothetical protein
VGLLMPLQISKGVRNAGRAHNRQFYGAWMAHPA